MKLLYAIAGAFITGVTGITINLLSSAIQQRTLQDQFSNNVVGWLIGLTLAGLLLGVWLGTHVTIQTQPPAADGQRRRGKRQPVTMTRFAALLSYTKLRGQGVKLTDILLIGSIVDIDTRE